MDTKEAQEKLIYIKDRWYGGCWLNMAKEFGITKSGISKAVKRNNIAVLNRAENNIMDKYGISFKEIYA